MSEYITKTEYLKDQVSLKEERLSDFESNKKDRHTVVNKMQTIINKSDRKMDENTGQIISLGKDMEYLKEEMKEIKELIKGLGDTFATKAEHKSNSDKISFIYKIFGSIGGIIIVTIVGAILNLILK